MKYTIDGHGKLAYALLRLPDHHAQPCPAEGYCLLNNAELTVLLALDSSFRKVAVIDIDVHYGSGMKDFIAQITISLHMKSWFLGSSEWLP